MGDASAGPGSAPQDGDARMLQGLVERIRRGSCILVLGPGVAIDPADATRTPLTRRLARTLAQDEAVSRHLSKLDPDDLRQVSEAFFRTREDRIELELKVTEFYAAYDATTSDFHRALAALPFRLCICTTPDKLMFNALAQARAGGARKTPRVAHYDFQGAPGDRAILAPAETSPLVYHLYGNADDPGSLVLTESDLVEFLVNVVRGAPPLPPVVQGLMSNREATFLFVGFGFVNWYVRVLLHVLNVYGHRNRPVAMEDPSFFANPGHKQTVMFFSDERSIEFQQLNWDDFATRLRDAYMAKKSEAATPASEMPGAPRAFLCYASEDREAVERLGERLQAKGIATWRDKDNLRSGDNWNRALVHVIEKQVDYVIVCQSKAMDRRLEGYYHKEIDVALERRFKPGVRFVLSAKIEECVGHPALEHLHFEMVQGDEGVERLAVSIREDWQARSDISAGVRSGVQAGARRQ